MNPLDRLNVADAVARERITLLAQRVIFDQHLAAIDLQLARLETWMVRNAVVALPARPEQSRADLRRTEHTAELRRLGVLPKRGRVRERVVGFLMR